MIVAVKVETVGVTVSIMMSRFAQAWLYFMRTRVSFLLIHGDSINVWWREYYQRGYSTRVIADDYHGKRYFVVVTDADEIPSMRYVLPVRLRQVLPFVARYNMNA